MNFDPTIILIRHGKTYGNTLGRYIGTTDEPLCEEGILDIKGKCQIAGYYPPADVLYTSPMLRCRETASLIYPELDPLIVPDLRETDFGLFENKNYKELSDEPLYQQWIDSNGTMPFPDGEKTEDFRRRCRDAFCDITQQLAESLAIGMSAAIVAHGGTIMSILEAFDREKKSFYEYQVKNGSGFITKLNLELFLTEHEVELYETLDIGSGDRISD